MSAPTPIIDRNRISARVAEIAAEIDETYAGTDELVLLGVLKGSFVFLADLVRELSIPVEVDFVRARSYGSGTRSSGTVEITKDVELDVDGRDLIVVEDIADTGLTMEAVVQRLESHGAASVARCALLARQGCPQPDYCGFEIGPGFVVGYGIDYAEQHRGERGIRTLSALEAGQPGGEAD